MAGTLGRSGKTELDLALAAGPQADTVKPRRRVGTKRESQPLWRPSAGDWRCQGRPSRRREHNWYSENPGASRPRDL